MLTADVVAGEFQRVNSWRRFDSARELVDSIDMYMSERGLARSTISRLDIAEEVLRLRKAAEPVREPMPTPEQAAWDQHVAQGTTADDAAMRAMDEMALAQRVQAMSMAEFSAARGRLGLHHRNVTDFLGGVE